MKRIFNCAKPSTKLVLNYLEILTKYISKPYKIFMTINS